MIIYIALVTAITLVVAFFVFRLRGQKKEVVCHHTEYKHLIKMAG